MSGRWATAADLLPGDRWRDIASRTIVHEVVEVVESDPSVLDGSPRVVVRTAAGSQFVYPPDHPFYITRV